MYNYIDVTSSDPHMTWRVLVLKDVPPLRKLELVICSTSDQKVEELTQKNKRILPINS